MKVSILLMVNDLSQKRSTELIDFNKNTNDPIDYSSTIQHLDQPSCKNCVHFQPALFNDEYGKCLKFGRKNVVTDKINYDFASFARFDHNKCGFNGKYFTLNENLFKNTERLNKLSYFRSRILVFTAFLLALYFCNLDSIRLTTSTMGGPTDIGNLLF